MTAWQWIKAVLFPPQQDTDDAYVSAFFSNYKVACETCGTPRHSHELRRDHWNSRWVCAEGCEEPKAAA